MEISVSDNGPGLSSEDVDCILNKKVYDSGKIGMQTAQDAEELQKSKGSGFGLMNCKGIIEKYRKTNALFRVCCFRVESRLGEGSRFYFRLPKGTQRVWGICLFILSAVMGGCASSGASAMKEVEDTYSMDVVLTDSLIGEANRLANRVYEANLEGRYEDALLAADSTLVCLNAHYLKYAPHGVSLLQLTGEGASAEQEWFAEGFDTDYYTLLDVRNEAAVAYLALGELDAYRYNNQAYVSLYKQISVDVSLEEYCTKMKLSANNKVVAILLCVFLLIGLLVSYYLFYLRHRLMHRYGLEQVFETNRKALAGPVLGQQETEAFLSALVTDMVKEMNELIAIDCLAMAVYDNEQHNLCYAFSAVDEWNGEMKEEMAHCQASGKISWNAERKL